MKLLIILTVFTTGIFAEVEPWAQTTAYGDSLTFNCSNTKYNISETMENVTWILPDQMNEAPVSKGWADATRTITGEKGEIVTITDVQPSNSGIYVCLIKLNDETYAVKRGVNLAGPAITDIWEKYQNNVMIGGIAAAAMFGVVVVSCLVYRFRYNEPKESEYTGYDAYNGYKSEEPHYDNPGLVTNDEKSGAANGAADDTRM